MKAPGLRVGQLLGKPERLLRVVSTNSPLETAVVRATSAGP